MVVDHQQTWRPNVRLEVEQVQVFAFLREPESLLKIIYKNPLGGAKKLNTIFGMAQNLPFLGFILLNSSQSTKIKFMCLSKAKNIYKNYYKCRKKLTFESSDKVSTILQSNSHSVIDVVVQFGSFWRHFTFSLSHERFKILTF